MRPIGYVLLLLIAVALAFSATRLGAQREILCASTASPKQAPSHLQ